MKAAQLQQMQDMYATAQQAIVPILTANMETAANHLSVGYQTDQGVDYAAAGATSTQQTAAVIASLVAQIAKSKAVEIAWNTAMQGGDLDGDGTPNTPTDQKIQNMALDSKDASEFASKAYSAEQGFGGQIASAIDATIYGSLGLVMGDAPLNTKTYQNMRKNFLNMTKGLGSDYDAANLISAIYGAGTKQTGYGYDAETALKSSWSDIEWAREHGLTSGQIDATFAKNLTKNPKFLQKIVDSYLLSDIGEDTDSGGGGSGSGSGSGNKDNSGTKKERVDLVLCSKKEIPKLNVNLFKKPPTFTVLNKNFKVRDVKINTEDTPKAIMSSIKNAFIDVQKRSDPKIIQDEDAVYDPNGATDGNPLPSGTAKTKTDSS